MPDESEVSLHESLENAFNEHAPEGEVPGGAAAEPASTPATEAARATSSDAAGRTRDEAGRFARKPEAAGEADGEAARVPAKPAGAATPSTVPSAGARTAQDQTGQPDPYGKAPQSWKPGAREGFAALPAPIREEIHRREREVARAAQEHATARNVSTYVQRLQQQFAPALQAEGVDALTASANLMNLASRLRFGTPVEKARIAADIVRNYGVDVVALAAALDGAQNVQSQAQTGMQFRDPRVDQLLSQLQSAQMERSQGLQQRAEYSVESFGADPKNEFFNDVRYDMGDLMELAAKRGIDMSIAQAYERACLMHPEISKVLAAREAATRAGNGNGSSIQRARAAASSVRGTPASGSTPPPTDLRGAIESAIEQVAGR